MQALLLDFPTNVRGSLDPRSAVHLSDEFLALSLFGRAFRLGGLVPFP